MTEIINTNFANFHNLHPLVDNDVMESSEHHYTIGHDSNEQQFHQQNCFSVIIKENRCPYDLLLSIDPAIVFKTIKIQLLKKNGNLLKIQQQQSKTFLIRKFLQHSNLYQPRIDPITGDVYFRLDYFQFNADEQTYWNGQIKSIQKSINLEKLYQSVQKFSSFYEDSQQNNSMQTDTSFKNQYQQLSKAICVMNDSNFVDLFSAVSQENEHVKTQSPQTLSKKNFLSDMNHFGSSGVRYTQQPCNKRILSKQMKEIEFEANNLGTLTKRKQGKSNFDTLLLNHNAEKLMKDNIYKMVESRTFRTNMKVVDSDLGKITLNFEKEQDAIYRTKVRFLNLLPRNTEYHFLDKYFKNTEAVPVLISLSLKDESLHKYFQTNSHCLSMQTKMRILLQICSAVHTLWQEKNIIMYVNNLKKIYITKNLTIKLRNLTNFCKVDPHLLLEDKALVNVKLLDNWLNLSEIYFKIFFGYDLNYVRPAAYSMGGSKSAQQLKAMTMSRRTVGAKLLPQGFRGPTKQILIGLNYIFLSFIDMGSKLIIDPNTKKRCNREMFFANEETNQKISAIEQAGRLLSYKLTCCWLFKNFQLITKEGI